jgi:hypothetical protein
MRTFTAITAAAACFVGSLGLPIYAPDPLFWKVVAWFIFPASGAWGACCIIRSGLSAVPRRQRGSGPKPS